MKGGRSMSIFKFDKKTLGTIGIVAQGVGLMAGIIKDRIDQQQMDNYIKETVNKQVTEALKRV